MERINEHQVRCVITLQDLEEHKLTTGDLKYGTKEIRALFNEVIGRAVENYKFNEDHLPVMVEAIPIKDGELLVILSAVENVEELDPHFAHFQDDVADMDESTETADAQGFPAPEDTADEQVVLFSFDGIGDVIRFCHRIATVDLHSELYRGETAHGFYLALFCPDYMQPEEFVQFKNSLREFREPMEKSNAIYAWLREHNAPVVVEPHVFLGANG
ncbi:MAG: adaptor protein MecA [Lachnospiraceae bacterium]|nr:adaptor protein MecA [Lachnospiraceae bacterium]